VELGIRYRRAQNEETAAESILPVNKFRERENPRHNAVLSGL